MGPPYGQNAQANCSGRAVRAPPRGTRFPLIDPPADSFGLSCHRQDQKPPLDLDEGCADLPGERTPCHSSVGGSPPLRPHAGVFCRRCRATGSLTTRPRSEWRSSTCAWLTRCARFRRRGRRGGAAGARIVRPGGPGRCGCGPCGSGGGTGATGPLPRPLDAVAVGQLPVDRLDSVAHCRRPGRQPRVGARQSAFAVWSRCQFASIDRDMRGANPAPLANLMERCGDEVRDVACR